MKKTAKMTLVMAVILSLLVIAPVKKLSAQFSASVSFQTFYNELSPYGQWIDDPEFGYIWIPDAGPGFRPYYSRGHWVMTGYGSMWVSDYSWGWAPFHYGRWAYSSYYGWVWVPDNVWGPAWVSWRSGGDYYGWAPLGPGISISISFGRGYSVPYDWWVFVPDRYILSNSFYNYRIAPERNVTYINNTTIINNTYVNNNVTYAAGPRVNDIERVTRSKVPVYSVANESRPGKTSVQGNSVKVFRPQVTKENGGNSKPPSVITRDQFVKNKGQRNTGVQQNTNVSSRTQQANQPSKQIEKKQVDQQNNNKTERNKQINQPVERTEQKNIKQVPQQNKQERQQIEQRQIPRENNRQAIPERGQQNNQQRQQVEQRQAPQQNRQVIERSQQQSQPQRQTLPQQQQSPGKGKGKKDN